MKSYLMAAVVIGIVVSLLFSGATVCVAAKAAMADPQLIDAIRQNYEKIGAFASDFEQTLTHKESGSTEKRKGRIIFQKPMRLRWQTAKPHEETLVVTNKEIWDYLPDEEIAYRYSPQLLNDSRSIISVITGQAALTRDFDVKDAGRENGLARLLLYPHEPSTQMVEGTLWVDTQNGRINRAKITDFYGNTNDIRLNNFQPGYKPSTKDFQFSPPKGVDVEDRIEKGLQERELFK